MILQSELSVLGGKFQRNSSAELPSPAGTGAPARRRNLSRSPRSAMLPAVPPQPLHRNRRARRGAPRSQPLAAG